MAVNKVVYGNETLLDLTNDTVNSESLVEGATAHGKDGEVVVGANPYKKVETDTEVNTQASLISQIKNSLRGKAGGSGGIVLPELTTPATASDIWDGKEAIDGSGNKIIGTIQSQAAKTITPSTSSQTAVASGVYTTGAVTVAPIPSNYEDVADETSAYTAKINLLESAVTALETELAGKASGGTSNIEAWSGVIEK